MRAEARKREPASSYLEWYQQELAPQLKAIDLLIKTSNQTISVKKAAAALQLTEDELTDIMKSESLEEISRTTFFTVMAKGSSPICALFRRELDCGSPYVYSIENIAYIYDIDLRLLKQVCGRLKTKEITAYSLPYVLAEVPMPEYVAPIP